jgi:hypothetical protein
MRALVLVAVGCAQGHSALPGDGKHQSDAQHDGSGPVDVHSADASSVPRTGLVAEWLFAGDAGDSSGNHHIGTVNGATLVNDRFGRAMSAYHFDGASSMIEIADAPDLALTGDSTISAWIKPDAIGFLAGIVSKYQQMHDFSYTLRFGYLAPYSYYDFDSFTMLDTTAPGAMVTAGQWQHVAVVVTAGSATIYANGAAGTPQTLPYTIQSNTDVLRIGVDYSTRYFKGAIDDVRLYSRALAAEEIAALYGEHP